MIASDQLRGILVQNDEDFRQLFEQHQELETRLAELSRQLYRSASEEGERVTLKKRKLQLKDRMEQMLKSRAGAAGAVPSPLQTDARG
jgi:uncharacterized protein YdcH (DUF465 family)